MDRKLAAVLSADVVGFSRLTALDEEATVRALSSCRSVIAEHVKENGGRIFGSAGDGFVAEFPSAVQAIRCSVEIQRDLARHNEGFAANRRLDFRIGVNLGDVVVLGDDLLGDSVNVAARLQEIAAPSAIYISGSVREHIHGKVPFKLISLGKRTLKNLPKAVSVFRVDWEAGEFVKREVPSRPAASKDISGPPIIAILPFENLGAGGRWERLAAGLSADIIADLARYPDLTVISRQTMISYKGSQDDVRSIGRELKADYILEGNLQAVGQQVRISVQLVDASSGADLWAARYNQSADDLFEIQDRVTENVVNVLANSCGKLLGFRRDVVRRKKPASLQAYDYYLLGDEQHDLYTRASNADAIRLLSRAVELDPTLARAWTALGLAYSVGVYNGFANDLAASMLRFEACIEQALTLDPADALARLCLAGFRAKEGNFEAAAEQHNRVLAMAPNDADTLAILAGNLALVAGEPKQGCELARRAIFLNPHVPWYYGMLGRCCFVAGLYNESVAALHQAPAQAPATFLFLAMAFAMLERISQAEKVAARLHESVPDFSAEAFIQGYPVTNPPALTAIREGAACAGLISRRQ